MKQTIYKIHFTETELDQLRKVLNHYNNIFDPMVDNNSGVSWGGVMNLYDIIFDETIEPIQDESKPAGEVPMTLDMTKKEVIMLDEMLGTLWDLSERKIVTWDTDDIMSLQMMTHQKLNPEEYL